MDEPGSTAFTDAVLALRAGGVIAYPTEAVYGLGCDPHHERAVAQLLRLKGRPTDLGLILIASEFAQLAPFLAPLDAAREAMIAATWPGPVTWVWPARAGTPAWLTGGRDTLAVRVTAHPTAAALCHAFGGALTSTSANPHGQPPARDAATVRAYFGAAVPAVIDAPLGGLARPTEIRDARSGTVLRPG
jgi:L-threonylcarbamoyladenylate synthase